MALAVNEHRAVAVRKRKRTAGVDALHGVGHFVRQGRYRARRLTDLTGWRWRRFGKVGTRQDPPADDNDKCAQRNNCQPASTHLRPLRPGLLAGDIRFLNGSGGVV
jgi:hypothetical protein